MLPYAIRKYGCSVACLFAMRIERQRTNILAKERNMLEQQQDVKIEGK